MIGAGHSFDVLSIPEEEVLHRNVLRIVAEIGLQIEHDSLLERMSAVGGIVDRKTRRVTFPEEEVERFIARSPHYDWASHIPHVATDASIFHGRYLDPVTDAFEPMTIDRAKTFYHVARAMPHTGSLGLLGCPFEETPSGLGPLHEKYWGWRLGAQPGGAIHNVRLCPYIEEMFAIHAAYAKQSVPEAFVGSVWLHPPLRLAYLEAEHVAWFLERGLRVNVGTSLATGGATAPATLGGMVAVTVAECMLIALLNLALFGRHAWGLYMSVTAMDARTAMRPYGRPDMALANLIGAQMARRYGVGFGGHCGLTDSMRPSPQASAQKMLTALPTLMAGGDATIPGGLLGVDEIFSPVQTVLDDQMTSALAQFARPFEMSDASIGVDTLRDVGPGGSFLAEPHTAEWLRREVWEPEIWDRRGFTAWLAHDGTTDIDRARTRVQDILHQRSAPDAIGEDEIRDLEKVLSDAEQWIDFRTRRGR